MGSVLVSLLSLATVAAVGQDYEVADISCHIGSSQSEPPQPDRLSARLRKPAGFRGEPLFADDRRLDPHLHPVCQIRPDPTDPSGLIYNLLVTDFAHCGILRRNGFVNVRLWFAQLPGVVTMSDQEVIIMCKPTDATVTEQRSAAFAGTAPAAGRVSGVVEQSPQPLHYQVALYRETSPHSGQFSARVQQPVAIGTRLQLVTTIDPASPWQYAKLLEVTVSDRQDDPHAPGHVLLVQESCRNPELTSLVLTQPDQAAERPHEVRLTMEAFLLGGTDDAADAPAQLWIHTRLLACTERHHCQPEFCLDLFQPHGHGRRRRAAAAAANATTTADDDGDVTTLGENVGLTVVMPQEMYVTAGQVQRSCASLTVLVSLLASFLAISCALLCFVACRLQRALAAHAYKTETLDDAIQRHICRLRQERERVRRLHAQQLENPAYAAVCGASATTGADSESSLDRTAYTDVTLSDADTVSGQY